jgi:hypothetical protein
LANRNFFVLKISKRCIIFDAPTVDNVLMYGDTAIERKRGKEIVGWD